jgi:zinc resistance-associated protein
MKRRLILGTVLTAAMVFMLGYGPDVFAGWGRGGGPGGCGGGSGFYGRPALSPDAYKALDAQRQAFFAATSDLRQQIYAKDLALRTELAKESPDAEAAAKLQQELSSLEGDLEQKRLAHMIEMRKLNPNAGQGYASRGNRGPGGCWGGGGGPRCW